MVNSKLFEKLIVIELASVLAGPAVGMFFAEHGAQVIKIENKRSGGDITRKWKLPQEDQSKATSAYYDSVNYGKSAILLDLTNKQDLEKLYNLVEKADIVISNYLSAVAEKLKVRYKDLIKINKHLIFGQIIGYRNHPDLPAFDAVMQAEMGFVSMNGSSDGQPAKMPVALIDVLAAHHLKEGILTALWNREKTGRGAHVDVALDETALSSLVNQASNYLQVGHIPYRMGTLHPNIALYGDILRTIDNAEIMLAIGSDQQYFALLNAFQIKPELQKFDSNYLRLNNRKTIINALQEFASQKTKSELMIILESGKIPFGEVRTLKEIFDIKEYNALILRDVSNKQLGVVKSSVFTLNDTTNQ